MEKKISRSDKSPDNSKGPADWNYDEAPWHRGPGPTYRFMLLSWFGCGLSPKAPGTVGSLGALPLGVALQWAYGQTVLGVCALVLFFVGWAVAHVHLGGDDNVKDPQWIVVDEVVGQWIALASMPLSFVSVPFAFALFRLFDINKPWPVSWADRRVGGALGIMLDDLLAGLYAAGVGFGVIAAFRAWTGA
jgi:phosphatidylglycerophosphatase A